MLNIRRSSLRPPDSRLMHVGALLWQQGTHSRRQYTGSITRSSQAWMAGTTYPSATVRQSQNVYLAEGQRVNLARSTAGVQTLSVTNGTTYTLSVHSAGSAGISGAGSGTATQSTSVTFVASGTSVTVTPSDSGVLWQLEAAAFPSSYIPPTSSSTSTTRLADSIDLSTLETVIDWSRPWTLRFACWGLMPSSIPATQILMHLDANDMTKRIYLAMLSSGVYSLVRQGEGSTVNRNIGHGGVRAWRKFHICWDGVNLYGFVNAISLGANIPAPQLNLSRIVMGRHPTTAGFEAYHFIALPGQNLPFISQEAISLAEAYAENQNWSLPDVSQWL